MGARSGLKLGVIGFGLMGQNHARTIAALPGVTLAGIAEPDPEKSKQAEVRFGLTVYANYQDLFSAADAIVVAAPTSLHYQIGLDCLAAGKHLLIEKPLAQTREQARELLELAEAKQLVAAVGFIERFNPAYQGLLKLLRKEKIVGVHAVRFSPFPERISDANVIQDMMIHDLDLVLKLFPREEVETIKATGEKVKSDKLDKVSATIFYNSGIICKIEADRVFGVRTRKITVTTDTAIFEADLLNKQLFLRDLQHHLPSVHHLQTYDQLSAELTDFVKAIKKGAPPAVTFADGLSAQALAEEVEKACS